MLRSHGDISRIGVIMYPGAITSRGATRIQGMNNYEGAVSNSIPVITEGSYTILLVTTYVQGVLTTNAILHYYITSYSSIPAITFGRGVTSRNYSVPYSTTARHLTTLTSSPAQRPRRSIRRGEQLTSGAIARRSGAEDYYIHRSSEERKEH